MSEFVKIFSCKICNKKYSSQSSLCNHNKKFHSKVVTNMVLKDTIVTSNVTKKVYKCIHCLREFNFRQNKYQHEKTCKNKIEINKIEQLENKIHELESKINSASTINNTTNNNIINNNIIIGFGKEDIMKLTNSEKKKIIGKGYQSMLALIDTMHCNKKYPEFNNIQITNLRDNCAKIYDDTINDYKIVKRDETIDQLISNKSENLGDIIDELEDPSNGFHKSTIKLIKLIQSYSPNMKDKDSLDFYKDLCKNIIHLIYNKTKSLKK
jgi:hypothetical protein